MAQSSVCRTFSQNFLLDNKDKLAGAALTKGNNIRAVSHVPILALAVALPVVFTLCFLVL